MLLYKQKHFLIKDNNTKAKVYKPKYRTLKTKIPNNKTNKI